MRQHDYFEHDADIGVVGTGDTLEESFEAAAEAAFEIQCEPGQIRALQKISFEFREDEPEIALVVWLNRLIAEAQARKFAFRSFSLRRERETWLGEAVGEPWRADMNRGVEVKGASLTMLFVGRKNGRWEARCVVDV